MAFTAIKVYPKKTAIYEPFKHNNQLGEKLRWQYRLSVSGDINSVPYFKEAFLTVDAPPFIYGVTEKETDAENAGNSATVALLNILTDVIRKSDKTEGRIISEKEQNNRFQLFDMATVRKFATLSGIKIDDTKFRNL